MNKYLLCVISLVWINLHAELVENLQNLSQTLHNLSEQLVPRAPSTILDPFYDLAKMQNFQDLNIQKYVKIILEAKKDDFNQTKLEQVLQYLQKQRTALDFSNQLALTLINQTPHYFTDTASILFFDQPVMAIGLSKKDNIIAAAGYNMLRLINVDTKKIIIEKKIGTFLVRSIAFHPEDQSIFALGGSSRQNKGFLQIYQFNNNQITPLATLKGHTDTVTALTFNHAGTILASIADDGRVILWDTQTWQLKKEIGSHNGYGHSVSFNSEDTLLATGALDGTVKIWNVQTSTLIRTFIGSGQTEPKQFDKKAYNFSVALFHPTNPDLVVIALNEENYIKYYNVKTDIKNDFKGGVTADNVRFFAFDEKGEKLAARDKWATINLWNTNTQMFMSKIYGFELAAKFCPITFDHSSTRIITGYPQPIAENKGMLAIWTNWDIEIPQKYSSFLAFVINTIQKKAFS